MVEATTQLNYTLNAKVTAANTTTIITTGTANNVKATTVTIPANITVESATDFNMVAANCNTNVCFFCQKTFTNVYNCRRHIRTHSGEKVDHYFYSTVIRETHPTRSTFKLYPFLAVSMQRLWEEIFASVNAKRS